jgi:hypothetical protein
MKWLEWLESDEMCVECPFEKTGRCMTVFSGDLVPLCSGIDGHEYPTDMELSEIVKKEFEGLKRKGINR